MAYNTGKTEWKRTPEEVEASVRKGDYTGGYKFWPWLLRMRLGHTVGLLGNLALGWYAFSVREGNDEWIGWACGAFFGVLVPVFIGRWLVKDYNRMKKGISS